MTTWHVGLFLTLLLGQVGVNGRKQVRHQGMMLLLCVPASANVFRFSEECCCLPLALRCVAYALCAAKGTAQHHRSMWHVHVRDSGARGVPLLVISTVYPSMA
jgi:hypothetical protein